MSSCSVLPMAAPDLVVTVLGLDTYTELTRSSVRQLLGIVSQEAAKMASDAGLDVVMNRCMKIEFARLFGGLNFVGVNTKVISGKRPNYLPY